MSDNRKYELASAYVAVIPSMDGFSKALKGTLKQATPQIKKQLGSSIGSALKSGFSAGGASLKGIGQLGAKISTTVASGIKKGADVGASALKNTVGSAAKTAMAGIGTALGAAATISATSGASRALSINEARANMEGLGYSAEKIEKIMSIAQKSVDGTAHGLGDAAAAAADFAKSGMSFQEIETTLGNVGKVADMTGSDFSEIATFFKKQAANGIVQWEDLTQLIDKGFSMKDISAQMGISVGELKEMASESKLTFEQLNQAIGGVKWDSQAYAMNSLTASWKNFKSALGKISDDMFLGAFEELVPLLNKAKDALNRFSNSDLFKKFEQSIISSFKNVSDTLSTFIDRFSGLWKNLSQDGDDVPKFVQNFRELVGVLKNSSGVIAGLGAALGSGFLSQIPVIGSLFGGLTKSAGLMIGVFAEAYGGSEKLRDAFRNTGDILKSSFLGMEVPTGGFIGKLLSGEFYKEIGDRLGDALQSINQAFTTGNWDANGITKTIKSIMDSITGFIGVISAHKDEIFESIGGIVDAVTDMFKNLAGAADGGNIGEGLGNLAVNGLQTFSDVAQAVLPVIGSLGGMLAEFVTSDAVKGALEWAVNIATYLSDHEGILVAAGTAMAALFVAGKFSGPLSAMIKFFKGTKVGDGIGKSIGKGLSGAINGIKSVAKSLVSATPDILLAIGSVGAIAAGVALVYALLESTGANDQLIGALNLIGDMLIVAGEKLGTAIAKFIEPLMPFVEQVVQILTDAAAQLLPVIGVFANQLAVAFGTVMQGLQPVFDVIIEGMRVFGDVIKSVIENYAPIIDALSGLVDSINGILGTALSGITDIITASGNAISTVFDSIGGLIESFTAGFTGFLSTLVDQGALAAVNASALAVALTALGGAMAVFGAGDLLGTIASGLGNLFGKLTEFLTGEEAGAVDKLANIGTAFQGISSALDGSLAEGLEAMSLTAAEKGVAIGTGLINGIQTQFQAGVYTLQSELTNLLSTLQAHLDANPLTVKVNSQNVANASSMGGNTYYSNQKTYNINTRVSNSSTLSRMLRSAR